MNRLPPLPEKVTTYGAPGEDFIRIVDEPRYENVVEIDGRVTADVYVRRTLYLRGPLARVEATIGFSEEPKT